MSLLSFPNENELLNNILYDINSKLGITISDNPGSIARAMTEAYNKQLSGAYDSLSYSLTSRFLSTASGSDLDMLGRLLSCYRINASELDENFRYRISRQVFAAVNANRTSIILSALSMAGIKNVAIDEYGAGNGSFILYVLTDELTPSNTLIESLKTKINDEIKAFGIRAIITTPKLIKVNLKVSITIKNTTTLNELVIKEILNKKINDYMDTLTIGETPNIENLSNLISQPVSGIEANIVNIYFNDKEAIDPTSIFAGQYTRFYLNKLEVISYAQ